ncbi:MAG: phosphopentomutase [Clostridia bacterium]|nr:phosphopentomutase [Clostridia bacterium]
MKRIFLIVLDSFGIGEAPDACDFGDVGANTLKSIAATGRLDIPNLTALGLGNIDGITSVTSVKEPYATTARLCELSRGKDTTTGHWEISGIISESPMPTYPDGFPFEVIDAFEKAVGRKVICNLPYSGTDVIRDYGKEHIETGKLIVYTSADSVFQIAAHEDIIPVSELYEICKVARKILVGKHGVGRVIARPFIGSYPDFKRSENRRDFSLVPPKDTVLNILQKQGFDVIGVGKIGDIFAMSGITKTFPTHNNSEGMKKAYELLSYDFNGLCFINLVDFDMLYGHRQDAVGYANAINEFDKWLTDFLPRLGDDDLLMITADHGCDPSDNSTDHTREYVPFIAYNRNMPKENLGTIDGFNYIGRKILELLGAERR